jgi:hypothetical protein
LDLKGQGSSAFFESDLVHSLAARGGDPVDLTLREPVASLRMTYRSEIDRSAAHPGTVGLLAAMSEPKAAVQGYWDLMGLIAQSEIRQMDSS